MDTTEHKISEHVLAQRTSKLEAANQELESLTYTIAHDLRTPVRAIAGYSRLLGESHPTQLECEGQALLKHISDSAMRMGKMVDDFLDFLHIGRSELQRRPVDTEAIVRCVLASLEFDHHGRNVEITIQPLPACIADSVLILRVWTHLIANAIKFTRPCEVARIEIGSITQNGRYVTLSATMVLAST